MIKDSSFLGWWNLVPRKWAWAPKQVCSNRDIGSTFIPTAHSESRTTEMRASYLFKKCSPQGFPEHSTYRQSINGLTPSLALSAQAPPAILAVDNQPNTNAQQAEMGAILRADACGSDDLRAAATMMSMRNCRRRGSHRYCTLSMAGTAHVPTSTLIRCSPEALLSRHTHPQAVTSSLPAHKPRT